MSWTNLPSISISSGSKIITVNGGTSTASIRVGDGIQVGGFGLYEVEGVFANQLTLVKVWGEANQTNAPAVIVPTFGDFNTAVEALRTATTTTHGNFAEMEKWWSEDAMVKFLDYEGNEHSVRSAKKMDADVQAMEQVAQVASEVATQARAAADSVLGDVDVRVTQAEQARDTAVSAKDTSEQNKQATELAKNTTLQAKADTQQLKNAAEAAQLASETAQQHSEAAQLAAEAAESGARDEANRAEIAATTAASALQPKGDWDASTGNFPSPTLAPERSDFYQISKSGTMSDSNPAQPDVEVEVGDQLYWHLDRDIWYKIDNTDQVRSVDGKKGDVVIDKYTKAEVDAKDAQNVKKTGNQQVSGIKEFLGNLVAKARLWVHGGNGMEFGIGGTHENPHHVIEANAGGGNFGIRIGNRVTPSPDFDIIATEAGRPWAINVANDANDGGFSFQVASQIAAVNDVLNMKTVFVLEPDSATFNYPVHAPAPTQASHLTRRDWVEENFVDVTSPQDVTGNKKFSSPSLELSGHWFNDVYQGQDKNYIHLYPNGGHANPIDTEIRTWDGSDWQRAMVFEGNGNYVNLSNPRALLPQELNFNAYVRKDWLDNNFLSVFGGILRGALKLIGDNSKILAFRKNTDAGYTGWAIEDAAGVARYLFSMATGIDGNFSIQARGQDGQYTETALAINNSSNQVSFPAAPPSSPKPPTADDHLANRAFVNSKTSDVYVGKSSTQITNFNDIPKNVAAFYWAYSSAANSAGTGMNWAIEVIPGHNANSCAVKAYSVNTLASPKAFMRTCNDGAWSGWHQISFV